MLCCGGRGATKLALLRGANSWGIVASLSFNGLVIQSITIAFQGGGEVNGEVWEVARFNVFVDSITKPFCNCNVGLILSD